ncbi:kinase-like domain-containing protein [Rhizophagus clarus]|uniref:Kinase-like domain-containing protein n=1 Tax=Rhizophagus clarus TaxID=94130 RepID=A0A8H3MET8_9GLOM|nr:kinase-like domain-containing protein [Rhizophagus clarus]
MKPYLSAKYHDINHDEYLAIDICRGFRPTFNIKVPQLIVHLIKSCLDANPSNRPTMGNVIIVLKQWSYELGKIFKFDQTELINFDQTELMKQVKEADEVNKNSSNEILLDKSLHDIPQQIEFQLISIYQLSDNEL